MLNTQNLTSVAIFEDNHDLREGLRFLLDHSPGLQVVGAYPNCAGIVENLRVNLPQVVLMDIEMPEVNGLEGLRLVREHFPETQVVMLTVFEDNDHVFKAICLGAAGYLLKRTPPGRIVEAIGEVLADGSPMTPTIARKVMTFFTEKNRPPAVPDYHLTPREKEVLGSLVRGNSYKMIAAELGISLDTVRAYIKRIYEKLHVCSQTEAVAKALRQGLVP